MQGFRQYSNSCPGKGRNVIVQLNVDYPNKEHKIDLSNLKDMYLCINAVISDTSLLLSDIICEPQIHVNDIYIDLINLDKFSVIRGNKVENCIYYIKLPYLLHKINNIQIGKMIKVVIDVTFKEIPQIDDIWECYVGYPDLDFNNS